MYRLKKKIQFRYLLLVLFLGAAFIDSFLILRLQKFEKDFSQIMLSQVSIGARETEDKSITLMFVGDIMLDRGVEYMAEKYGNKDYSELRSIYPIGYKFPFFKIAENLKMADILFGNLEGPVSDKGIKVGSIYSFRADPKAIEGLTFAGFDILSVTNNHILDYGRPAMEDTFSRLKESGINYVGGGFSEEEARNPVIKEIKGVKIAFLSYTNLGSKNWAAKKDFSGIAWLAEDNIKEDVKKASNRADLVIVSFHFGDEYQTQSNSEQKYFSHLAVDYGADLVVGHHPHVAQEVEQYKKSYIAYSLGNFIFDQGFSEETMRGLLLKVIIEDGKIKTATPIKIKINEYFQPELLVQ